VLPLRRGLVPERTLCRAVDLLSPWRGGGCGISHAPARTGWSHAPSTAPFGDLLGPQRFRITYHALPNPTAWRGPCPSRGRDKPRVGSVGPPGPGAGNAAVMRWRAIRSFSTSLRREGASRPEDPSDAPCFPSGVVRSRRQPSSDPSTGSAPGGAAAGGLSSPHPQRMEPCALNGTVPRSPWLTALSYNVSGVAELPEVARLVRGSARDVTRREVRCRARQGPEPANPQLSDVARSSGKPRHLTQPLKY
jgi:hypothetical protein